MCWRVGWLAGCGTRAETMPPASRSRPSRVLTYLLSDTGYLAAVWIGFYVGVKPIAWLASAFAWVMVLTYGRQWLDLGIAR